MRLSLGLRGRMLLATILPAIVVALTLAAILLDRQYRSLDEAMQARVRADALQLASTAEFGVFAGNREVLQALVRATLSGDGDVLAVSIYDPAGVPLAASGKSTLAQAPAISVGEQVFQQGDATVAVVPILRSRLPVDDFYSDAGGLDSAGQVDGYVVFEMSRRRLDEERNRQLLIGVAIAVVGCFFAAWLALSLARGVIRPILHIGDVVDRIGQGDTTARVARDAAAVMPGLEEGINHMAQRVGFTQDFLKQQIDTATAELRQRKDEAERANSAKSRFVAAASHDLRQPLHALGLFVSQLGQLPLQPEVKPLVRHIDSSVQSLQDLLESLLDSSRIDAGLVTAKPADFPLADLFARLALEYNGPAEEKGLELRVRYRDLWLRTDPRLLERILMNFIGNALRYTARGGVLLACRKHGDKATIQVWDTGVGIPPGQLQAIFSEYVQLSNPERNHAKGLGLGLSICDRLARLLGLAQGVRSVPGRGSVFWIEVPLGIAGETEAAPISEVTTSSQIEGTVVVIDGDERAATGMAGLIAGWGCRVIGAASSLEAIARCEEAGLVPDLVITDTLLPSGEDGVAAGLVLRRRYGVVPVLVLSGDVDDHLLANAARRHFALLVKPVRPGKLRAIVQQMMAPDPPPPSES
ncbi:MAG: response regulator [Rhodocyclales bacterium]|nr:response regulator [Rhodocyclales bacterium]